MYNAIDAGIKNLLLQVHVSSMENHLCYMTGFL